MSNTAWQNGRRAVGKVGIAEALIIDVDGKRYARATTTCLVFPLPQSAIDRRGRSGCPAPSLGWQASGT